jgi:hypothetical protein
MTDCSSAMDLDKASESIAPDAISTEAKIARRCIRRFPGATDARTRLA